MFGLTQLETRLASIAMLLVVTTGWSLWERHVGALKCERQQSTAALQERAKDTGITQSVLKDFDSDLQAIPVTASHVPVLMCSATSEMPARPATRQTKSDPLPNSTAGVVVLPGDNDKRDIGGSVQDIAYSCLLGIADSTQLWNLSVKESEK